MLHMVGASAPVAVDEPSPGQVWLTLASCGRLWPAVAGSGAVEAWLCAVGAGQVRPTLHLCFGSAL
jgi:hypothetical protein